ncbi:hypothetical protein ACKWRH_31710 [Bradyrhizobium sp. Pa8]|uniref:hypothetical protein n=1 Tax=Bradyrhizobium sp. Pa8 TaxID=3386552 RepID=UPI00403F4219
MDNLRRFPAPWVMEEEKECFRVKDANGFLICRVHHREDLHAWGYQYAYDFLSRDEARHRIERVIVHQGEDGRTLDAHVEESANR